MNNTYSILLAGLKDPQQSLACGHFSRSGYQIITAKSLTEAKDKLKNQKIDLVYLQPSAGQFALDELRQFSEHATALPVVLVCAQPTGAVMLEMWHAGAADIIILPMTSQSLDSSLQRAATMLPQRQPDQTAELRARFRYRDEVGKELWVNINPPRFTVGRSSMNDLVLGQMGISRSHAAVVNQNGEYWLRDLGSKHGTYVNGIRVEETRLTNGDRVQLGGLHAVSLTFHQGDLLQSLLDISQSEPEISLSVHGFKEIGMLLAAFRALSSIPLLDDLLDLVVDSAIDLTGADRGFIMLKEENEGLSFRCARNNCKHRLDGSSFQTSHRIPHEVFETGQRIVINDLDVEDASDSHGSTRQLGLRSVSCVPLRYLAVHESANLSVIGQAETIGVLYVDSQDISARLSDTQINALETLASEAAMAIYNARLYKESQEKHKLDEQLAIAREIQQALLPQPNKILPYVCACSQNLACYEVGGDYFDYFDLDGGRFGFALGDVAGKGMSAALLASMLHGIFSAQTFLDAPLPTIISNVNRNLAKRGIGNRFVTFFFGILDPEGNCTYVNAGHNPPILVGRDGSLKELTEGGMVLGLFAHAQYESGTIKLQSGDHLVLFTDGVLEALNSADEEFGEKRLHALLEANARSTAPEILACLQKAVLSFSSNVPQHDDITMMILGFQEPTAAKSIHAESG